MLSTPTDYLAQTFLFATRESVIILLTTIGFLCYRPKIFGKALCLLLFTLIFNYFLKSLWQLPRPDLSHTGWAFPSGHMQSAIALWGCLVWELHKRWFRIFTLILLSGVAFALIHFNYHSIDDILGSLFFGGLTVIIYQSLCLTLLKKHLPYVGLILALLTLPLLALLPEYPLMIWVAEGSLVGFSLGWIFQTRLYIHLGPQKNNSNDVPTQLTQKILLVAIALTGLILIRLGFSINKHLLEQPVNVFSVYFCMSFWVSGISKIIWNYLKNTYNGHKK